jgi:hypothetical protein
MPAAKQRPNPKAGSEFVKEYKGKTYKLKVVKVDRGAGFQLRGTIFSSPSSAAKSITKTEINGWRFWKID